MNAISAIRTASVDTFTAWRVLDNGTAQPLDLHGAATLDEAKDTAAASCSHRNRFMVRYDDARTSKAMLHTYVVKQGKRQLRRLPGEMVERWVTPLKPELEFSLQVASFAPVEPWKWSPGADVVGIDRSLVEG